MHEWLPQDRDCLSLMRSLWIEVETEALYTACLEVSEDSRITLLVSNQSHTRLVLHGSLPGHMNGRSNGSTRRTNMGPFE
jgi:hypothetical protein